MRMTQIKIVGNVYMKYCRVLTHLLMYTYVYDTKSRIVWIIYINE